MISEGAGFVILHKSGPYLTLRIAALARQHATASLIDEAAIKRLMGWHL